METPDANAWIQEQNKEVQRWSNMVTRRLKTSAAQFSKGKTGMVMRGLKTGEAQHAEAKLASSLGRKVYFSYGLAEGVGFRIERHGVFVQKGVGRGYIAQNGTVIRGYRTGKMVRDMAKAKNRNVPEKVASTGGMNRSPVNWFNSVLELTVPDLFNKICEINADAAINAAHMMIK